MTEQTGTRKPTPAQRRAMIAAVDADGHLPYPGNTLMYRRIVEAGWAAWTSRNRTPELTRAGYVAAGRVDRFALPEVKVGDLLRYVTHPGCVVRVRQVLDGGRVFTTTYVSVCGVCEHSLGSGDPNARREPRHSHMHAQTLDGQPAPGWRTPAYLVEPVPAADAEQIERDILDTLDAHVADRKAHDRGELPLPRPLYTETIRPELLDWPAGRKMRDLTPGQRLMQSRRAGRRLAAELSSPAFAAAVADDGVQQATGAALAGGERVRTVFDECAATLPAAGIDPEQPAAGPAPFEIGDRVTWGPAGLPENRGLIVWTVRRVWRDERGWHAGVVQNGGVGETGTAAPAEQFHRLPAMPAEHSVITFGYDHTHPDTGGRLDKMFVRIPGDRELARARAFALFGTAWAFDYSAATFAEQGQVERYGLIEVATPSEAVGLRQVADDSEMREYVERQIAGHELDRLASALRYGTDGR